VKAPQNQFYKIIVNGFRLGMLPYPPVRYFSTRSLNSAISFLERISSIVTQSAAQSHAHRRRNFNKIKAPSSCEDRAFVRFPTALSFPERRRWGINLEVSGMMVGKKDKGTVLLSFSIPGVFIILSC